MAENLKSDAKDLKKEKKAPLPLSAWLGYLLISSLILSSVSLARYTTLSSQGYFARVAVFADVSAGPEPNYFNEDGNLELNPNGISYEDLTSSYHFYLYFDNYPDIEVLCKCDLIVELPEPLPDGVKMYMDGISYASSEPKISDDKRVYTYENVMNEAPVGHRSFTLRFTTSNGAKLTDLEGIEIYAIVEKNID